MFSWLKSHNQICKLHASLPLDHVRKWIVTLTYFQRSSHVVEYIAIYVLYLIFSDFNDFNHKPSGTSIKFECKVSTWINILKNLISSKVNTIANSTFLIEPILYQNFWAENIFEKKITIILLKSYENAYLNCSIFDIKMAGYSA